MILIVISRSLSAGETWRNLLSWMPRSGSTDQVCSLTHCEFMLSKVWAFTKMFLWNQLSICILSSLASSLNILHLRYSNLSNLPLQPAEDSQRFPGRGRTLGSARTQATTEADLSLQVRLLDDNLSNER